MSEPPIDPVNSTLDLRPSTVTGGARGLSPEIHAQRLSRAFAGIDRIKAISYDWATVPRFPELIADKALNPLPSSAFNGTAK
jgi:hypothetical protein